MKRSIAIALMLCLICVLTASCKPTLPEDTASANDATGTVDTTDTIDLPYDTTEPPHSHEHIFVNESGNVCINHHYGNRNDYKLVTTPVLYVGDTENLEDDVLVWGELSGEHIIVLAWEKMTENIDSVSRRLIVYTSKDMGENWTGNSILLPTPVSREASVTNMVLSMTATTDYTTGSILITTDHNEVCFFVTEDGGETWEMRTYIIHYDTMHTGRLVDESIGFISFVAHGESGPEVFITENGGKDWRLMDIPVPDGYTGTGSYVNSAHKYNGALVLETVFEEGWLNYVSVDNGQTWEWERH